MRWIFATAWLALASACTSSTEPAAATKLDHAFPKGFLWGTATAGFQVDMGCPATNCDDPHSDWYQWVTDPELKSDALTHLAGDPPSAGPGFWETWPNYLDAAQTKLHNNALRYSLEWSRLFPMAAAGEAKTVAELKQLADPAAVAKYHAIFAGAKQRGLKLLVTLNHYTLPLWLHDGKACHADLDGCKNRGWLDHDRMLTAIALYSAYCAQEFGGEVDLWGTLNEPFAVVVAGYILPSKDRTNPPGVALRVDEAVKVAFNMMEAHAKMVDAVHEYDTADADGDGVTARVGIVANLAAVAPKNPADPKDVTAAQHADWVYNRAFLEATIHGELDRNLDGKPEEQRADMKGRMDFIGINYYTQLKVSSGPLLGGPAYPWLDFLPDTGDLFSSYPQGIYEVVMYAKSFGLPIIITENGTGDAKDKALDGYLKPHLAQLHRAIADGAKVEGYFYWTLMDNYEWNHGLNEFKMGMFAVDPKSKTPVVSPLATGYGRIATDNGF